MKSLRFLAAALPVVAGGALERECTTALSRAQSLQAPLVQSVYAGEAENLDFWEEHNDLLQQARREWGRKHPALYTWNDEFVDRFLDSRVGDALRSKSVSKLKALFEPTEKQGVHKTQLFNPEFVDLFLDELAYQEESQIPMRRPNGMNRYGCILDEVGFGDLVKDLSSHLLRPMAHILFSNRVAVEDLSQHYGFVVQYHPDADVNLAEHADASAITINICLQPSQEYSPLYFKNVRELYFADEQDVKPTNVTLDAPGVAAIHLGQHIHGVSNVTSARSNMVVWLQGDYGYVRVAPYEKHEVAVNEAAWMSRHGWY